MSKRVFAIVIATLAAPSVARGATPAEVRIQQPQLESLERAFKGKAIDVVRPLVQLPGALCFDPIEIENLSVKTQVDSVAVAMQAGRLELALDLSEVEIRGTLRVDGSFPCFDVEDVMDPLLLRDVHVTAAVGVSAGPAGELTLSVIETQATVGSISGTGTIADLEADFGLLTAMFPSMVDMGVRAGVDYANTQVETNRAGVAFGMPYRAHFTKAEILADGIVIGADLDAGIAERAACLPPDATQPIVTSLGRTPPPLSQNLSPDSGLVLAASADLPGRVLASAWWAGLFCGEASADPPRLLRETLERLTGRPSGTITVSYSLAREPRVDVYGDRVRAELDGMHVEAHDPSSTLLAADFRIVLAGTARIDPDTRLVLGSIDVAEIEIASLDSALLDSEDARAEMIRFLEEDLPGQLTEQMKDTPVADAVFFFPFERVLLDLVQADDGFRAAVSPHLFGDPAADALAPETMIGSPQPQGWTQSRIELGATDDRPGTIVYSWSLDGGPWSPWSTEMSAILETPPGPHEVQAIARDRWGNVDATPATVAFEMADARDAGCGCSLDGAGPRGFGSIALAIAALALVRRRRALAVVALVAIAPRARAEDTRVMPAPYFTLSLTAVSVLNNPPSDVTSSSVSIPTGAFPLGLEAKAKERHRVQATLFVPSAVIGVKKGWDVVAYLPVFKEAEMRVQEFEVRAAGVNMTPQAQEALRVAGFKSPSGDADPVSTWRGSGIGDFAAMVRWRAIVRRDSALLLTGGMSFPTGRNDDPRILTDFAFGDPSFGITAGVDGERRLGKLVVGGTAGYRLRLPGEMKTRPVGGPTVTMMHDPGDVIRAGVSVRRSASKRSMPAFSFAGAARVEHHLPDRNNAGITLPDQRGTAFVASASVGANNVKLFLRHRFLAGLPGGITFGAERSFSSKKNLQTTQATARLDLYL